MAHLDAELLAPVRVQGIVDDGRLGDAARLPARAARVHGHVRIRDILRGPEPGGVDVREVPPLDDLKVQDAVKEDHFATLCEGAAPTETCRGERN